MALRHLVDSPEPDSVPIRTLRKGDFSAWLAAADSPVKRWVESTRFEVEAGKHRLVPSPDGGLAELLLGLGDEPSPWDWAGLA
ncbi:MAG: leucyl aminopeptidase family protein, partial [Vicinamibacteria bacterium]